MLPPHCFHDSVFGRELVAREQQKLTTLLPQVYYPVALQIGSIQRNLLVDCFLGRQLLITDKKTESLESDRPIRVISDFNALPVPARSADLVVLPHLLDEVADPFPVLRELSQVVVSAGYLVIIGFNPYSLIGMAHGSRKLFRRKSVSHHYRLGRVQDWLALLNFKLVAASMLFYRPPLRSETWLRRLNFIENAGARWWPVAGGVYILVTRKQDMSVNVIPPTIRRLKRIRPGLVEPITRKYD